MSDFKSTEKGTGEDALLDLERAREDKIVTAAQLWLL